MTPCDLTLSVQVDTTAAEATLDALQQRIDALSLQAAVIASHADARPIIVTLATCVALAIESSRTMTRRSFLSLRVAR